MSGQCVCASHSWGSESASFFAELTTEITLMLYVTESSQTRVTAEVRFFYLHAGSPISLRLHFVWAARSAALRESVGAGTGSLVAADSCAQVGDQLLYPRVDVHREGISFCIRGLMCTGRGSASVSAD